MINICITEVSEGEKRERGPQGIFEKAIAENFPNMGKKTVTQVQEAKRNPGGINSRRNVGLFLPRKLAWESPEFSWKEDHFTM